MDMSTTTFGVVVIQSAAVLLRRFSVRTVTVHGSMEMNEKLEDMLLGYERLRGSLGYLLLSLEQCNYQLCVLLFLILVSCVILFIIEYTLVILTHPRLS